MMPVRRDIKFEVEARSPNPETISTWHGRGVWVTHFMNAMSLFFPHGERFFMDSVRNYRDQIDDPVLKQQVNGFIGQEAMHGREHVEYNRVISTALPIAAWLEKRVGYVLRKFKTWLSKPSQLALTTATEHYTAIIADRLLQDARFSSDMAEPYRALWFWHALEENEHKAVCFDVYEKVCGTGVRAYLRRVGWFATMTVLFWSAVLLFHVLLIATDKRAWKLRELPRNIWQTVNFIWGAPGVLRQIVLPALDYFKPSFHPWDHDNRHILQDIEAQLVNAKNKMELDLNKSYDNVAAVGGLI